MSADAAEIARLERRHRDIAKHGPGVIQLIDAKEALMQRRRDYVAKHNIKCFRCGGTPVTDEWARCGRTNGRYWAICVPCVRTPRSK